MNDGKTVRCLAEVASWPGPHDTNRGACFFRLTAECGACPHSTFTLQFQVGVGNQEVACPRWRSDAARLRGEPLLSYVMLRRETCLVASPFPWCYSCANHNPGELPRSEPGWWPLEPRYLRPGVFEED